MQDYVIYYLRGGQPLSPEHRRKISEAMTGRPKSIAHRRNISIAMKALWKERKENERRRR